MTAFPAYTVDKIENELTDDQIVLLMESRVDRVGGESEQVSTESLALKALNNKGKVNKIDIEDLENMPGFAVEKVVVNRG